MDRRFDPRSIVTPYAFAVHPDLLGMPLATPWQRLGAILVDLVVIGFISQVGLGPLAVASTLFLFWMATRKPGRDAFGKVFRIAVGCLGLLVMTITLLAVLWLRYGDRLEEALMEAGPGVEAGSEEGLAGDSMALSGEGNIGLLGFVQGFRGAIELQQAETREEAQSHMDEVARGAFEAGLSRTQVRDLLVGLIPEDAAWRSDSGIMLDETMAALGTPASTRGTPSDTVTRAEATVGAQALSPTVQDSIAQLNRALQRSEEERADLETTVRQLTREAESEGNVGILEWMWSLIDELGIGVGWAALYLTVTHAWWNGTSIGKRLFRIRVVMIDKRPLSWWLSFERAGGYAAGFATGLLGFAQIFWDPNRQAIHDKVSETMVIQEGKQAVPGPWIEEGRAQWQRGRPNTTQAPLG